MSVSSDVQSIINHFVDNFGVAHPEILIAHDNVNFTPPMETWVRLSVSPASASTASVGASHVRRTGLAFVQIFTPLDQGAGEALSLSDEIATMFRHLRLSKLLCGDPVSVRIGPDETHYQMNVQIPYRSDTFS